MAKGGNDLGDIVAQMKSTIEGHFMKVLDNMEQTWKTEHTNIEAHLERVKAACDQLKPEMHAAFVKATTDLKNGADANKSESAKTLEVIHAYEAHLHESGGRVQELVGNVITQSGELGTRLQHIAEVHAATHDQVAAAYTDWNGHVDQMLGGMNDHQGKVTDALHSLADQTHGHMTDLGTKLQHAGEITVQHVTSLVQTHGQHSEELVNTQKEHLLQTIATSLGGKSDEVLSHLGEFGGIAEQASHVFDGGLGDVLHGVDGVMGMVQSIEPVLKIAEELA